MLHRTCATTEANTTGHAVARITPRHHSVLTLHADLSLRHSITSRARAARSGFSRCLFSFPGLIVNPFPISSGAKSFTTMFFFLPFPFVIYFVSTTDHSSLPAPWWVIRLPLARIQGGHSASTILSADRERDLGACPFPFSHRSSSRFRVEGLAIMTGSSCCLVRHAGRGWPRGGDACLTGRSSRMRSTRLPVTRHACVRKDMNSATWGKIFRFERSYPRAATAMSVFCVGRLSCRSARTWRVA